MNTDIRTAIDLIDINESKEILLTNKKGTWILPWGKKDEGERDIITLNREINEEINEELNGAKIDPNSITPYKTFTWLTPFSQKKITVICYFGKLLSENITASAEIMEARYEKNPLTLKLSDITKEIIETLITDWYLDKK